ncbi:hypothetical protein BV394_06070 [Brevirhabdus pacifica]|uniref:Uncharacterized protein n=1 Tax=Brevirhabdus pacifica TaxID=1267768 RepID=A0A1U7DH85_9RHOB|nr:hypothetical protein [Brevirhabdus pacifica]APX89336.1 hypothetical protein BV394_06070 [Brevirhabdus pacifica]OWU76638.1 hypothetical protein ATO5_10215 [Loktanella sp. 22II-4b]PJJ86040.1 hypothetical protein CLV77_0573 [Brevirhabdus pacifica]
MSDPVKQAPFEDVLSSIRRLVREETGDPSRRRPRVDVRAEEAAEAAHAPQEKPADAPVDAVVDASDAEADRVAAADADKADRADKVAASDPYSEEAKQGLLDSLDMLMGRKGAEPVRREPTFTGSRRRDAAREDATGASTDATASRVMDPARDRPEALVLTPAFRIRPEAAAQEDGAEDGAEGKGEDRSAEARADEGSAPASKVEAKTEDTAGSGRERSADDDAKAAARRGPPLSAISIPEFLANRRGRVHDSKKGAPEVADDDAAPAAPKPAAEEKGLPWFRHSRRADDAPAAGTTEPAEQAEATPPVDTFYEDEHAQEDSPPRIPSFEALRGLDRRTAHEATRDALADVVKAMSQEAAREALERAATEAEASDEGEEIDAGATEAKADEQDSDARNAQAWEEAARKVEAPLSEAHAKESDKAPEEPVAKKAKPLKDTSENIDRMFAEARAARPDDGPQAPPADADLFESHRAAKLDEVADFQSDEPEVEPLAPNRLRRVVWAEKEAPLATTGPAPSEAEELDEVAPSERFGAASEPVMDEEALRELVAEMVRAELQGALGERITRNVRKLVRREIHQMLAAQDFD